MTVDSAARPATHFTVPPQLMATEPPEERGLERDAVRLLVANGDHLAHARFRDLATFLEPGDLVVANDSATIAAAVDGRRTDGRAVVVHFSTPLAADEWVVELRDPDRGRVPDGRAGEAVRLPFGVVTTLLAGYPDAARRAGGRLWRARTTVEGGVLPYLDRVGRPITYDYVRGSWPLSAYQTVFAREPGSAEMPSAGRPFTPAVLAALAERGVHLATLTLHTGVSSLEAGELPLAERFQVPAVTAAVVNATRAAGRRVVAVGTTVTRALETAAGPDGVVSAAAGWTDLVLGPDRPARAVDGLVTGWHESGASHLLLLEAVAGSEVVGRAYQAALDEGYLWHEFGDSCLLLRPA